MSGAWTLLPGDMRAILASWAGLLQVDAVVCDPPYELTSTVSRFGKEGSAPAAPGVYGRSSAGFMGKRWDGTGISFDPAAWRLIYEVMKPGAYLIAFGGTRTHHRIACAIEDAGFEIRDSISWVFGTGFPKSHNVSRGIDKTLGAKGSFGEPKSAAHAGWIDRGRMRADEGHEGYQRPWMDDPAAVDQAARTYIPGSPEAAKWAGWGSALKPAHEPIIVARKPLTGTIAANTLQHGVGGLNIDACRVPGTPEATRFNPAKHGQYGGSAVGPAGHSGLRNSDADDLGRWPANVVTDGSETVTAAFPDSAGALRPTGPEFRPKVSGDFGMRPAQAPRGDSGSAARFFNALPYSPGELAQEAVIVARKPLIGTIAENVLAYGTGGLNIDACRVPGAFVSGWSKSGSKASENVAMSGANYARDPSPDASGRWPADLLTDGSPEVLAAFAAYGQTSSTAQPRNNGEFKSVAKGREAPHTTFGHADSGTPVRFFNALPYDAADLVPFCYGAKASKAERAGSQHPTVKPQALMRWLCRLVTPPGGTILDPFAGSGSTLQAALAEGFSAIGIEMEADYIADIRRRMGNRSP